MTQRSKGIVFADISGITRMYQRIGTSEAQRALERCVRRIERAIESHQGATLMPAVDEMVAVFSDADTAVAAAVDMQLRLADLPPASGVKLSIRIGVHFGTIDDEPDGYHGPAIDAGRALLNIAGLHQILICAQTAAALSPTTRQSLRSLEDITIETSEGETQVYEIVWQPESKSQFPAQNEATTALTAINELADSTPPAAPAAAVERVGCERFCVRFNGKAYLVDARTPVLTIGRDKSCTIVIRNRKASRVHVRLEKRGDDRFFLIDQSTNGTYVVIGKEPEVRLHDSEILLTARGRCAFGHSTAAEDAEFADFEPL